MTIPAAVDGCTGVVAAGDHSVAVTETGNVLVWGVGPPAYCDHHTSPHGNATPKGVLGTFARWQHFMINMVPDDMDESEVESVAGEYACQTSEKMALIATSESHAAAVDVDGLVWTWGAGHSGQLGHGENIPMCVHTCMTNSMCHPPSLPPLDYRVLASWHPQMPPIHHVSYSEQHTLAVTKGGAVWGWGTTLWVN